MAGAPALHDPYSRIGLTRIAFFFNVLWAAVKIALDKGQGVVSFIAQVGVLRIPAELTIYVYSKVFSRGDNT